MSRLHCVMPPACQKVMFYLTSLETLTPIDFRTLHEAYWEGHPPKHVPEPYNAGTILGSVLNRMVDSGWLFCLQRRVEGRYRKYWVPTTLGLYIYALELLYAEESGYMLVSGRYKGRLGFKMMRVSKSTL